MPAYSTPWSHYVSHDTCVLAVADSYNHKIKKIDVTTKQCTSYVGCGTAGNSVAGHLREVTLNEPGGVCVDRAKGILYIADTNNHCIKTVNVKTNVMRPFPIIFPSVGSDKTSDVVFKRLTRKSIPVTETTPVCLAPGGKVMFKVQVDWKPGIHLTEGAPSQWQVWVEGKSDL
ncbi:NHL repeat-containing protein 2-like [Liolophura sinensis]|uniref:NHL repeat-containing protein 2-like n=1 Tax=Liolophura sinensis TaxID=3198878 RepID=UPI0031591DBD